jgi:CubicO group peptidase (beta-lactamase class C family)
MTISKFGQHLNRMVPERMAKLEIPGAAAAIIEGGRVSSFHYFGFSDVAALRPVSENTFFSIQSISKSITSWGIMKLVDRAIIKLDAPISDYLKRWHLPKSVYAAEDVTIRRLLSHHAGISTSGINSVPPENTNATLIDGLNGTLPPLTAEQQRYYQTWGLENGGPVHIAKEPGKEWAYSNGGFAMLELMVEEVTGKPFAEYITDSILAPLGLTQSCYRSIKDLDFAKPYGPHGELLTDYRKISLAAGGLYMTISELARFACSEMSGPDGEAPGRGVISQTAMKTMLSDHGLADKVGEIQFQAGLGHLLCNVGGLFNVHHSGGSIGWRSIYSILPDIGSGFCMLINSDEGNPLWMELIEDWRGYLAP